MERELIVQQEMISQSMINAEQNDAVQVNNDQLLAYWNIGRVIVEHETGQRQKRLEEFFYLKSAIYEKVLCAGAAVPCPGKTGAGGCERMAFRSGRRRGSRGGRTMQCLRHRRSTGDGSIPIYNASGRAERTAPGHAGAKKEKPASCGL